MKLTVTVAAVVSVVILAAVGLSLAIWLRRTDSFVIDPDCKSVCKDSPQPPPGFALTPNETCHDTCVKYINRCKRVLPKHSRSQCANSFKLGVPLSF